MDGRALQVELVDSFGDVGGFGGVDGKDELIAREGKVVAGELGGVAICVWNVAVGEDGDGDGLFYSADFFPVGYALSKFRTIELVSYVSIPRKEAREE